MWGTDLTGTLNFNSPTANNVVTMSNGLNLNGADRTIFADSGTAAAYAVISGNIIGTGGLIKTGPGTLALTGTSGYNGSTTISGGALQANDGAGLPTGNLVLDGGMLQAAGALPVTLSRTLGVSANQVQWTAGGGGFFGRRYCRRHHDGEPCRF